MCGPLTSPLIYSLSLFFSTAKILPPARFAFLSIPPFSTFVSVFRRSLGRRQQQQSARSPAMAAAANPRVAVIAVSDGAPPGRPNPVNALSAPVRRYLRTSLRAALNDPSVRAVVLIGRPDGTGAFSAGADIREFAGSDATEGGVTTSDPDDPDGTPTLVDVARLAERSRKPIVAALTGPCLGGGMELALAAQYRVADDTLRYGLPEVKIGLLPGAGGTQRLPRLCGVRHALDVILRGRINCTAGEGMKCGFVDGVVKEGETVLECAMRWAEWASMLPAATLEGRRICLKSVPPDGQGIENGDMCDFARGSLPPKDKGGESAHACLEAVRASYELASFDEGMEAEKGLFNDLLYHSLQGRAYRHIFFAERASSSSGRGKVAGSPLAKGRGAVGVIGAGTMGRGIAISILRAGYGPVTLVDVNPKGLAAGAKYIQSVLRGDAKKGRLTDSQLEATLSRLVSSTDLSGLADCDLVVEAVFENLRVKKDIFSKLDAIVKKEDALLLSNTSTLDVDVIASSLSPARRGYCAGMHFFSPAHVMKLVEVVQGRDTSPATLDVIRAVTKRIRKVPIVVGNCDGFVGNRMLHPYTTESTLLLVDHGGGGAGLGVADVDAAVGPKCFGMAVGPFVMSDIAGNDIG